MIVIPFEIHITGTSRDICDELTHLGIKNIAVELLDPNEKVLRTEYMSSFVHKCTYGEIHSYVLYQVSKLVSAVRRVKIECPPLKELFLVSLYMEAHQKGKSTVLPTSRNVISGKYMTTKREYSKRLYEKFIEDNKGSEVELCIFDSWKEEDFDWFETYLRN